MSPEAFLRRLLQAAIDAALPAKIIPPHIPDQIPGTLVVIGAGKASAAMAAAVEAGYGGPLTGLVVTRYGHSAPCQHIEVVEAAHPVPDAAGAAAAERLLRLLQDLGPDDRVLALISGGGSSLLTLLPEGISTQDAATLNRALLASGASIHEMNCLRRHLSRTAGGRLAAAAHPAGLTALMISDVPGDALIDIASGPTVADPTTLADARAIVAKYALDLPPAITAALNDPKNESVKPGDPRLAQANAHVIAAPQASLDAATALARAEGFQVTDLGDRIEGEAWDTGQKMAAEARARQSRLTPGDAPLVLISGGETTVTLPRDGRHLGEGGRNVEFLLGLAQGLQSAPGIWAIAGDTDGVDGLKEVAGAIVTPDTLSRAEAKGVSLADAAHAHDGHGFFETLGDQVVTGPTLTNVNDFRAILIEPSE